MTLLDDKNVARKKAVAYYRHSAEDKQENSVPIQREHAENFCTQNNLELIHEEADQGVSGLTANRPGFKRLFSDWIENPQAAGFDYVLVYDVSRWGRFQNQNEAGYYEYLCNQNKKKIIYVSRGFPREEQELTYSIITPMERWMAAQYSKQLSEKVWYGCIKVSKDGYSAGGASCYGMARLLLDVNKQPIRVLKKGEHKQIANERVTFTPSNDETTDTVKEMFKLLVDGWMNPSEIAEALNRKGIPSASGGPWNKHKVIHILTNETYTGARIYNKTWGRLKQKKMNNPRSDWVITPNAFPAVVDPETFGNAQEHLYWLMPSMWKKGLRLINKTHQAISQEIKGILSAQGQFDEDSLYYILRDFPITYSVTFYVDSVPHWCFLIPEKMKRFEFVLGASIILDRKDYVEKLFSFPSDQFGPSNFLIFSEQDESYTKFLLTKDQAREKILEMSLSLAKQTSLHKSPVLTV